ncbi:MAG TPA: hypothetical protein PLX92_04070 [Anaerolineaceae bacterium]|nr:hypothetical protein [Anaerolineaceae bacterium]
MPFSDDVSHYASVVSWKLKQQGQIINLQGQIHELDSQIGIQKSILGDLTYKLFMEGALVDEAIRPTCEKIKSLYDQKEEKQRELEIIRGQKPPQRPEQAAEHTPAATPIVVEEVPPSEPAPEAPLEPEESKPQEPQS